MSAEDTSWVFDSLVAFLNGPIWNAPLQSFVEEKSLMTFVDETVDASELRKRQEYLRAQRDKLVAMKKEARQKQLSSEAASKARNRPKSAKAAEAVLNGAKGGIRASELQIRKTLAERLKAEVIEKQGN
ncbi:hypothetical protein YQE_04110, partial [Dendroctonus ponderosae]